MLGKWLAYWVVLLSENLLKCLPFLCAVGIYLPFFQLFNTKISPFIFVVLNKLFVKSSTNKILRTIFFLPFFTTFALGQ
jgi:hypothetical protein